MNWNVVSAIGTCIAAFVGVAGIWLNLWDKTRKMNVYFEAVPSFRILVSNNSLRTTTVTKILYSVETHIFHVEYFTGLQEVSIPPATSKSISISKQDIFNAYKKTEMYAICNPNAKIVITLYDNYRRKYTIKLDFGIGLFEE